MQTPSPHPRHRCALPRLPLLAAASVALCGALAGSALAATPPSPPLPPQPQSPLQPPEPFRPIKANAPAGAPGGATVIPGSEIVKTFDFEERRLGNYNSTPMFWRQVAGVGFPAYNVGAFSTRYAHSGRHSFMLNMNGGSVAYRLQPGKVLVSPDADYFVVAFVRTTRLAYAKANLTAWLATGKGRLMRRTEVSAKAWAAASSRGKSWHVLHLLIRGNPMGRSLVLQLGLYQPSRKRHSELGPFALYRQDIHGTAWFDDVTVFQLPRVGVTMPFAGNIVPPGKNPTFNLTVDNLHATTLAAKLSVQGKHGTLYRQTFAVPQRQPYAWRKRVVLPPLGPGAYTATLDIRDARSTLLRRNLRFLALAPLPSTPAANWAMSVPRWPRAAMPTLPTILHQSLIGMAVLPVWRQRSTTAGQSGIGARSGKLLASLEQKGIHVVGRFAALPHDLPAIKSPLRPTILNLGGLKARPWHSAVARLLTSYADVVHAWQFGSGSARQCDDKRYPTAYAAMLGQLRRFTSRPRLLLAWDALCQFRPERFPGAALNLLMPPSIPADEVPSYIGNFTRSARCHWVTILPRTPRGPLRPGALARRIIWAAFCHPRHLLLPLPITCASTLGRQAYRPAKAFLVYRTLAALLGGSQQARRLHCPAAFSMLLFKGQGQGQTLTVYSTGTPVRIALPLGPHPVLYSLFGKRSRLPVHKGLTVLRITHSPLLLRHIDAGLLELRFSFALAATRLPAGAGRFRTVASLTNALPKTLDGSLRLQVPNGWSISPRQFPIHLLPGQKMQQHIAIQYPFAAPVGASQIDGRLSLPALQQNLRLAATVHVESTLVRVRCTAHRSGRNVLVQQVITNISARSFDVQAYAMAPLHARQTRYIFHLKPNHTIIERYIFRKAADLHGKTALLGLRRISGGTLISNFVPLP